MKAILLSALRWLLFPFSILYGGIASLRNTLYNRGVISSVSFNVPTIVVGNLSVGGTGKTPHVEYLVRLLRGKYTPAILSRGYGRKSTGVIIADEQASAASIGDEPMQFFWKFSEEAGVVVGEDRVLAIPQLLQAFPNTEVVLLDDAFQHRSLRPSFKLLLSEYNRPFFKDFPLPTGMLREFRSGARRADVILMTKCPENLSETEKEEATSSIRQYALDDTPIFFTHIRYGKITSLGEESVLPEQFCLVSGIANPTPLTAYLKEQNILAKHFEFGDHHAYNSADIKKITQYLHQSNQSMGILLTEKDAVKWMEPNLKKIWTGYKVFYLPIEISFLDREKQFQEILLEHLKSFGKQGDR